MGDKGVRGLEGKAKLIEIIRYKEKDIRRFKEGFLVTIDRNLQHKNITVEEAESLKSEMMNMKV